MSTPGDGPDPSSRGREGHRSRRSLEHIDPVVILLDLTIIILVVSLVLALVQAVFGAPPQ
jgi:hypothetical protein